MRLLLLAAASFPLLAQPPVPAVTWKSLFDGRTLTGWRESAFPNHPAVRIEDGAIRLPAGQPLSGITATAETAAAFPRGNYEIRFEAARIAGSDFFSAFTFPLGESNCTFVTGGWGGDIIGLSSIDGWDASENETRAYFTFEPGHFYAFRLRVTTDRIQVWIDDRIVIDLRVAGRSIALRPGPITLSAPLGFASYNTAGAVRKIEYRRL